MAAGPKTIATEFLREAKANLHALGYAPGCDLFEMGDWCHLNDLYTALVVRLDGMLPALPEGTAEQVREVRYGSKT